LASYSLILFADIRVHFSGSEQNN